MYLDKSGLMALWDKIKTMFANIKTDLASTKTDLASTKGELSGVNAHLDSIEARINQLFKMVDSNFTTAKNDDAAVRKELYDFIREHETNLRDEINSVRNDYHTLINGTEQRLRQLIDAKTSFKVFDLSRSAVNDSAPTVKVNATEAELGETALAYMHFGTKENTVQFDLEYSDGATHRYIMYPHDIGEAIVVLVQRASGLGDAPDAYMAFALQPYNDIFMTEDEYNGQLPPSN